MQIFCKYLSRRFIWIVPEDIILYDVKVIHAFRPSCWAVLFDDIVRSRVGGKDRFTRFPLKWDTFYDGDKYKGDDKTWNNCGKNTP